MLKVLVNSLINLQLLLVRLLVDKSYAVFHFYWQIAIGRQQFIRALLGLVALFIVQNWIIILSCYFIAIGQPNFALTRAHFYLLQSPFFCFAALGVWQCASQIHSRLIRFSIKSIAVGYMFITMGSMVVSTGILPNTQHHSLQSNAFPLQVNKSDLHSSQAKAAYSIY